MLFRSQCVRIRPVARKFYLLLRGRVWYYRLRGELTFHTTHCTDRDQALEFVYTRVLAGRHGSGETLAEFVSRRRFFEWGRCEWIQRQHTAGHSFSRPVADQRKAHLEGHILPAFGATSLRDLGPVPIERWLLKLKLAPQTINHIRYTFRIVMSEAIRENLVAKNPLDQVVKHKVRAKSPLPFTLTELAKLFPHDEPELFRVWGDLKHAVCFLTLATTGLRSGEIRALNWGHILQQGIYIEFAVKPDNLLVVSNNACFQRGWTGRVHEEIVRLNPNIQEILSELFPG